MRFLHCADLHLDSKMMSNLTKEQAKERKKELLRTFVRMVDFAKSHSVTAILIAGDMFDSERVTAATRNLVRDVIASNPTIDFLYLKGNHDRDGFVSELEEIPSNLLLFDENWTSYEYNNVVVTGLELSKANQMVAFPSLVLEKNKFNIVMLHGQVADYLSQGAVETVSLNDLRNKNIDYLALGHVHSLKKERLDERGVYCYPGCLEGRGFDECGEKGFVLLEIDEETLTASYKFVPFAYRNLYELAVDVTDVNTTQEANLRIENAISKTNYSSNSMVKIVLTGNVGVDSEIDCDFLQDSLQGYFYFEKVENATKLSVSYEDYAGNVSLKGEFIRSVLASDLEENMKAEIIHCGIQALSGEEIAE